MSNVSQLSPQPLWQFFAQICSIPHPSHHEQALAQYIVDWAKQQQFFVERDAVGNILIRKPATHGMEKRQPVVLQAHLDMVPQKNSDTVHDFVKDPIQPYIDGEWVKARGTTLGADNGIGMASALAVLADHTLSHGPLEVLLTMTEETGMDGAFGLQPGWLQGEILINTDSETEGEVYMGCAGGVDAITTLDLSRESLPQGYQILQIKVKGLQGGHSGVDINLGLANANKLLARFLAQQAETLDLRLLSLSGGSLRNAIPREATAHVALPVDKALELNERVTHFLYTVNNEYSAVEHNTVIEVQPSDCQEQPLTAGCQSRLIALLNAMPNGTIRMSDAIPGIVETSLNVGVVTMDANQATIMCLIRSLVDSGKEYVVSMLKSLGQLAGAKTTDNGGYPGWKPDPDSPVMHLVSQTYQHLFAATPDVMVIHAGLECGLFKKPYPHMDMVSIGPTIRGPHSPDEKVHIASVGRYWQLLTALLKNIPERT